MAREGLPAAHGGGGDVIRDPYAATHFEPGCPKCDGLWEELLDANTFVDWEQRARLVTARNQAHAREAHDVALASKEWSP